MAWIYRLSQNDGYPNPAVEVRRLAAISARGEQAFLLLSPRSHPVLSGRDIRRGDPIYLAIAGPVPEGRSLLVQAQGRIGALHHGPTPTCVREIYEVRESRYYREVIDLEMIVPGPITARSLGLSADREAIWLKGQAHGLIFSPSPELALPPAPPRESGNPLRRVYDGLTDAEVDELEELTLSRSRG